MKEYQICKRCVMDTSSEPTITFDENGVCWHCNNYIKIVNQHKRNIPDKQAELMRIVDEMKKAGDNKEYDCVLGISGGIDSAYLAYMAKSLGLRVLAVHVDAGWNSEIAVSNIEKLCKALGIELHTIVVDWKTMKELQRAYLFSGLPNCDVPQDHAFCSGVYEYASKYGIKYMLSGSNYATEALLPTVYGYDAMDYTNLKDVYKKNGRGIVSLKKYPHMGLLKYFKMTYLDVKSVKLLDLIDYSKTEAIELLHDRFGWEYYGGKHFESRFTKWFQGYFLKAKWGYDKKRAHISCLVNNDEMTREEALIAMADNTDYPPEQIEEDTEYILKKLDISKDEFKEILNGPKLTEDAYKTNKKNKECLRKIKHIFSR